MGPRLLGVPIFTGFHGKETTTAQHLPQSHHQTPQTVLASLGVLLHPWERVSVEGEGQRSVSDMWHP